MSASPPSELRARVLEAARREPVRTRAEGLKRQVLTVVLGFAAPIVVCFALGGPKVGRPPGFEARVPATVCGRGGVAAGGGGGGGRSMLGRPTSVRAAVATLTPIAFLGVVLLASAVWPETALSHDGPRDLAPCLVYTLIFAVGPLVAFALLRRRSDAVAPRSGGAALGAAAGAWGAVGITLHCPHVTPGHVVLGHVLPVAGIALLGVLVGQQIVAIRTKTG